MTLCAGHLPLARSERDDVEAELRAAGAFWHPNATAVDVRLDPVEDAR